MGETYYDVLGVDREASQDEIRSAYRDRVLETHPDHNDDPDAADQFRRVSTAESVLTDETERARYDRLGHESYVKLGQHSADADDSAADDSTAEESADRSGSTTSTGAERTSSRTTNRRQRTRERRSWRSDGRSDAESDRTSGRSHHARQRSRRQRRTAAQRSSDEWPFDTDRDRTSGRGAAGTATATTTASTAERSDQRSETEFSYAVHGWNDEIDLDTGDRRLDQPTIVGLGTVSVLYPLFVYASLSPTFSFPTNLVVTTCTLLLVGYMLTFPRVAVVAFGGWSVLLPIGLFAGPADPVSLLGLLAIAFCWIPFGYAMAVRWALRL
ncbi:DnaJ domain-containing protein [Halosolutus halophilus]|uniref:DnaJ domain-containing protein n=1 Tax=Halosolutus halophilus TaxID=1552990 RepID=UPI00223514EE|nr:DnaJ domain-containing protein [Halosolutus halophilus]